MTKFGLATQHRVHEEPPEVPKWACGYYPKQHCGREAACCALCANFGKCGHLECISAILASPRQPKPLELDCPYKERPEKVLWDKLLGHGSDVY